MIGMAGGFRTAAIAATLLAGCAAAQPDALPGAPAERSLALGQRGAIGGVGVTPLRVEEDSRCPAEVQCIQAGTVRLAVRVEDSRPPRPAVWPLAEPLRLSEAWLTLCAVSPYPGKPGPIAPADYRFIFLVHPGTGSPPPGCAN